MQFNLRLFGTLLILGVLLFNAAATPQPIYGQNIPTQFLPVSKSTKNIISVIKRTKGLTTNFQKCLDQGHTEEQCRDLTTLCDLRTQAVRRAFPSFLAFLQLEQVFKVNCGTGECFQCCWSPSGSGGCHTSFIGYPVINCNPNYGIGTFNAGITLIVDADAAIGEACLFIPQTCEHIPACHSSDPAALQELEELLESGQEHPINSQGAIDQRIRKFGEDSSAHFQRFANEFSTEEQSLASFINFVTGRGCVDWKPNIDAFFELEVDDFNVINEEGELLEAPTRFNRLVQLGTLRMMGVVPNIDNRLAYVDSRVWTPTSKANYLAQVGDPDEALLEVMSPYALSIISRTTMIQDHQLLAVPLADEDPATYGNLFNGCRLGEPPLVELNFSQSGSHDIQLEATLKDTGQVELATYPLFIEWGDGTTSEAEFTQADESLSLSHTYEIGGKYLIYGIVENDSGLQGSAGVVVETASSGRDARAANLSIVPSISKVALEELTAHFVSLSGDAGNLFVEVALEDETATEIDIGLSAYVPAVEKVHYLEKVVGHNDARLSMERLIIRPRIVNGWDWLGFQERYFTLPRMTFHIFSTELNDYVTQSVEISQEMLQIYPKDSNIPLTADQISLDDEGNVKILITQKIDDEWAYLDRVEIEVTADMFASLTMGPLTTNYEVGTKQSWQERRPGEFVESGVEIYLPAVTRE